MNMMVMECGISVGDIPGTACSFTEGLYRLKDFTVYVYGCILALYGIYGLYTSVYFNVLMTGLTCKQFVTGFFVLLSLIV